MCLSLTLRIVDLWHCCVRCIRSGVTRCTFYLVFYLGCMSQCGLHAVLWSHIGILIRFLAAELRSTAGRYSPLTVPVEQSCWPSMRWCGTGGFQEQGQCFFIGLNCSIHFCLLLFYNYLKWRAGTRETEVRLEGWCEGGLGQQRNDGGSFARQCAKDRKEWRALAHL